MTDTNQKTETATATTGRKPTHRVIFQRKLKEGYGQPVELGGAWQNSKGGINFPFGGGSVTIWPITEKPADETADAAPAENAEAA